MIKENFVLTTAITQDYDPAPPSPLLLPSPNANPPAQSSNLKRKPIEPDNTPIQESNPAKKNTASSSTPTTPTATSAAESSLETETPTPKPSKLEALDSNNNSAQSYTEFKSKVTTCTSACTNRFQSTYQEIHSKKPRDIRINPVDPEKIATTSLDGTVKFWHFDESSRFITF